MSAHGLDLLEHETPSRRIDVQALQRLPGDSRVNLLRATAGSLAPSIGRGGGHVGARPSLAERSPATPAVSRKCACGGTMLPAASARAAWPAGCSASGHAAPGGAARGPLSFPACARERGAHRLSVHQPGAPGAGVAWATLTLLGGACAMLGAVLTSPTGPGAAAGGVGAAALCVAAVTGMSYGFVAYRDQSVHLQPGGRSGRHHALLRRVGRGRRGRRRARCRRRVRTMEKIAALETEFAAAQAAVRDTTVTAAPPTAGSRSASTGDGFICDVTLAAELYARGHEAVETAIMQAVNDAAVAVAELGAGCCVTRSPAGACGTRMPRGLHRGGRDARRPPRPAGGTRRARPPGEERGGDRGCRHRDLVVLTLLARR